MLSSIKVVNVRKMGEFIDFVDLMGQYQHSLIP